MTEDDQDGEARRVAYHEAGHAVLAWTYGLKFSRVSIVGTEDYQGVVKFDSPGVVRTDDTAFIEAHALNNLAGEVAVEILTGTPPDWGESFGVDGADIDGFTDLAMKLGWHVVRWGVVEIEPALKEYAAKVRGLLEERWPAVEAVAEALLHNKELSGTEALRIMAETDVPGPVATVWAGVLEERRIEAEIRAVFESE